MKKSEKGSFPLLCFEKFNKNSFRAPIHTVDEAFPTLYYKAVGASG
jgi:hypothetical protein